MAYRDSFMNNNHRTLSLVSRDTERRLAKRATDERIAWAALEQSIDVLQPTSAEREVIFDAIRAWYRTHAAVLGL